MEEVALMALPRSNENDSDHSSESCDDFDRPKQGRRTQVRLRDEMDIPQCSLPDIGLEEAVRESLSTHPMLPQDELSHTRGEGQVNGKASTQNSASKTVEYHTPLASSPRAWHDRRKPHVCHHPGCLSSFARAYDLDRHMFTHFPPKRHDCPFASVCGRHGERTDKSKGGFIRPDRYAEHLRKVHGEDIAQGRRRSAEGLVFAVAKPESSSELSPKGKSDRAISPNTMTEEDRRELIARQDRALYGNEGATYTFDTPEPEASCELSPKRRYIWVPGDTEEHRLQRVEVIDNKSPAYYRLMKHDIKTEELSQADLASFSAQNPQIQEQSIQIYAQNLAKTQHLKGDVINHSRLEQAQLASYEAQDPRIQEKSIQEYAQNLAIKQQQLMEDAIRPGELSQAQFASYYSYTQSLTRRQNITNANMQIMQASQAPPVAPVTPIEPKGPGVEGAPTGPKALREGLPKKFWQKIEPTQSNTGLRSPNATSAEPRSGTDHNAVNQLGQTTSPAQVITHEIPTTNRVIKALGKKKT